MTHGDPFERVNRVTGYSHQVLRNAREVPPRQEQVDLPTPIRVRVRLVWTRDGEEVKDGVAVASWRRRGYATLLLVQIPREPRLQTLGVWLAVSDVERSED